MRTNDPNNKTISLTISGQVDKAAHITPRTVRFKGTMGDDLSQTITIKPTEKYPFSIMGFWMQKGKDIKVDFKDISSDEKVWQVIVTNKKKDTGKFFDTIILKTDSRIIPLLKVRVYGEIVNQKIEIKKDLTKIN